LASGGGRIAGPDPLSEQWIRFAKLLSLLALVGSVTGTSWPEGAFSANGISATASDAPKGKPALCGLMRAPET